MNVNVWKDNFHLLGRSIVIGIGIVILHLYQFRRGSDEVYNDKILHHGLGSCPIGVRIRCFGDKVYEFV